MSGTAFLVVNVFQGKPSLSSSAFLCLVLSIHAIATVFLVFVILAIVDMILLDSLIIRKYRSALVVGLLNSSRFLLYSLFTNLPSVFCDTVNQAVI